MVATIAFIPFLVIVIIIFVVVMIAGKAADKTQTKEGEEKVVKIVYSYLVLFATLMMVIGGGIVIFMSLADIVFPEPYYQTFEEYKSMSLQKPADISKAEAEPKLSEAELRSRYNDMVKEAKDKQVSRAKNTLLKSLGWVIIPLPIFLYFQKRVSKKEEVIQ